MKDYTNLDKSKNLFLQTRSIVKQAKSFLSPKSLTKNSPLNKTKLCSYISPCKSQDRYIYQSRIIKELTK